MNNPTFVDYISLGVLIILATTVFIVRIFIPDVVNSALVNTLFSFFEITFSLLIGFLLQRIDSEKRFYKDLKKYGLSAYRRITDISKSLERAKLEISHRRRMKSDEKISELDIIDAIVDGVNETVKSSITDWMDIIGDDLKTQERLQVLESKLTIQKTSQDESGNNEKKINELQKEISELRNKLPAILLEQARLLEVNIDTNLGKMVETTSSFILKIAYLHDGKEDDFISQAKERKPYKFCTQFDERDGHISGIIVFDNQDTLIGQIMNFLWA